MHHDKKNKNPSMKIKIVDSITIAIEIAIEIAIAIT